MLRAASLLLLATATALGQAPAPPPLVGTVSKGVYTSPTGAYSLEVPVLPELGGQIRDTNNVVTFRDGFGLQISIGAFPHDSTLRWQYSTRGTKDYLEYFFTTFVLEDFKRFCPAVQVQSAGYSSDLMDGSLFTFMLLPGGSVFQDRLAFVEAGQLPVAKRGNMIFVKNGVTFVISTELSEKVTEGSRYTKTTPEEDDILRKRLQNIATNITFLTPPAAK